jgi:chemotaxis protein MotB
MKDDASASQPEIVIVRRRGGDDAAGGKGGAWKIAYADFVTAMMAFFLVMWLINASNEETRAQVASYFNPIKLTDSSTGVRSLRNTKESQSSERSSTAGQGMPPSKADVESEAELLANPPESIDKIAKTVSESDFRNAGLDSQVEIAPALAPDTSNPGVGDPFDPRAWENVKSDAAVKPATDSPSKPAEQMQEHKEPEHASPLPEIDKAKDEKSVSTKETESTDEKAKANSEALAVAQDIAKSLEPSDTALQRLVSVVPTDEGLLISLTEQENFEMFKTGSAEPRPEVLKLVSAIAESVRSRDGYLVIRGHTDSRPYRNKYYDNWQLSTARAHFARYMLLRGGLDEKRIRRIEGVADREPRNRADPQAAENRRIDILLSSEAP